MKVEIKLLLKIIVLSKTMENSHSVITKDGQQR